MTGRAKRISRRDMTPAQLREHVNAISRRYRERRKQGIQLDFGDSKSPERQHEYWVKWYSDPINRDKHRQRKRENARRRREEAKKNKEAKDDAC